MRYLIILLLFIQCTSNSHQSDSHGGSINGMIESEEMAIPESTSAETRLSSKQSTRTMSDQSSADIPQGSKVIKRGNLQFEVEDLQKSKNHVNQIIDRLGAHFENEQYMSYGNRNNYSLTIRVPNQQFDTLIHLLENAEGKLLTKSISADDRTGEYVDVSIKLENNLAYLAQYQELLKRANSIKDILAVQEKIRRLEEEINSRKGRLEYIDKNVKMSTVHVELLEIRRTSNVGDGFSFKIGNAFKNGFQYFLNFIVGLVSLWPFVVIFALLLIFGRRLWKWIRRK